MTKPYKSRLFAPWLALLAVPFPTALAAAPDETATPPPSGSVLPSFNTRATAEAPKRPENLPDDASLLRAGTVIGSITIKPLDIFDTSIPEENTALFRLANTLHINTRPKTIERQLLFEAGQAYDPRLLRESERLLRQTRYLREAWVTPVAAQDGKVDLEVTTRDVWTLNPGVSFGRKGGKSTSGFEIEDLNLLGSGAQLSLSRRTEIDRTTDLLIYRDRQLGNTWWSIDAELADNSDGKRRVLELDHGFYALDTRRAGGIAFADDTRVDSRYDLGKVVGQYATESKVASAYGGWSKGLIKGEVLRYRIGVTQDEHLFDSIGDLRPGSVVPADRKLVYPWVSMEWLQDEFREARNRDQIERTEDFQYGWQVSGRLGYAAESLGSSENALIFDASASHGIELDSKSTLLLSGNLKGRHDGSDFIDTVIAGSARYYHRQSQRRLWFAALSLEQGHKLDPDRQILLGGDNGLRGYPLRYQAGEGRWLFTVEQRFFSDWYPFRLVNVGGAIFADAGGALGRNPYGSQPRGVLTDVGIGLRLGNSRTALGNVLHIDLAFPLNGDRSISNMQLVIETKSSF
ncbi:MAG: hypothetical protein FGM43_06595 [Sinobacteraceae bacterium]|nr:hypothetical protein [Nevskiaceae bacterium]